MKKSLFVIVIGPSGSGKGYLMNTIIELLLSHNSNILHDAHNYKHVRIDDYVEKDKNYNDESLKIIQEQVLQNKELLEYLKELNTNGITIINEYLVDKPSKNLIELDKVALELSNLYFKIREKYDSICDIDLNTLLSERQNIVFETTGQTKFDWLFENTLLSNNNVLNDYMIIMIYPYVTKEVVLIRAIQRFLVGLNSIINENSINASLRLPVLVTGDKCLLKTIETIQNNIAEYINLCSSRGIDNKINTILLYDNMLKTPILSINLKCNDTLCFSNNNCQELYKFWKDYHNVLSKNLVNSVLNLSKFCLAKN